LTDPPLSKHNTLSLHDALPILDHFRDNRDASGQEAFRILVQRHGPMVLGLCRSLVKDSHEAEDAFQATFLVLVRRAESIRRRERSEEHTSELQSRFDLVCRLLL